LWLSKRALPRHPENRGQNEMSSFRANLVDRSKTAAPTRGRLPALDREAIVPCPEMNDAIAGGPRNYSEPALSVSHVPSLHRGFGAPENPALVAIIEIGEPPQIRISHNHV